MGQPVNLVYRGRINDLTQWKSYTTAIAATDFGRGRTGAEENSAVAGSCEAGLTCGKPIKPRACAYKSMIKHHRCTCM